MSWKGFVRSVNASANKARRESERKARVRQRELEKAERLAEYEEAGTAVEIYENYIERLVSVHKDCSEQISWHDIKSTPPPVEPQKQSTNRENAKRKLDTFKPGIFDKLLKQTEKKLKSLQDDIHKADALDEQEYKDKLAKYKDEYKDWEDSKNLAEKLFANDKNACLEVIDEMNSFSEIAELGSSLYFRIGETGIIEASIQIHGKEIIPTESKSLLKSGKLSVKKIPVGTYNELHQDYVCSCVLRVANELYAILPIDMVIVTAVDNILNTATGHIEEKPIVSAAIPRETLQKLNLEQIDPSDSLNNFVHKMNFKKTSGFSAVESINPEDLIQKDK